MDSLKNLSLQLLVSFIGAGIVTFTGNVFKVFEESFVDVQFCKEFVLDTNDHQISYFSVFNSGHIKANDVYIEISVSKSVPIESYKFIRPPGVNVRPEKDDDSSQTLTKRFKIYRDNSNGDNRPSLDPGDYFGFIILVNQEYQGKLIKSMVVNPSRSEANNYEPRRIFKKLRFRLILLQVSLFIIGFLITFIAINLVNWLRSSRFSEFSKADISTMRDIVADHQAMAALEATEDKKTKFEGALNKSKNRS